MNNLTQNKLDGQDAHIDFESIVQDVSGRQFYLVNYPKYCLNCSDELTDEVVRVYCPACEINIAIS